MIKIINKQPRSTKVHDVYDLRLNWGKNWGKMSPRDQERDPWLMLEVIQHKLRNNTEGKLAHKPMQQCKCGKGHSIMEIYMRIENEKQFKNRH